MAIKTYTVQRGDTLWGISRTYGSSISGNTIPAKIETLMKLNKDTIKNKDLIYVDQVIKLSGDSGSGSTSSTSEPKVKISGYGLKSDDTSGRSMIVNWTWNYKDFTKYANTAGYTCRWQQHLNGKWVGSDTDVTHPEDMYCQSTFSADSAATKVKFQVRPYYKKSDKVTYWSDIGWASTKEYDFSENPPLAPGTPNVEIDDVTLTASIDNIDAEKLDAKYIEFNLVQDNKSSLGNSPKTTIITDANYVSRQFTVKYGSQYKVRARSISAKGKVSGWSDFSSNVRTKPSAPKSPPVCSCKKRSDGSISAYLEWESVATATKYRIEYTTVREDFDTAPGNITSLETDDARTSIEVTGIETGHDYFFRVRAIDENVQGDNASEPTDIAVLSVGEAPAAPTTWSSTSSAFVGETMELYWTHNARDGSAQSYAELSLKINDSEWTSIVFKNTTNATSGEQTDTATFLYGEAVSYKGELYVKMDTENIALKNAKIQWKVRTAGITDAFSDTDWSTDRSIYIYEKPTLVLSVTSDLAGDTIVETLTGLPFYVRGEVDLDSYEIQRPIGYYLRVIANDLYETVDDAGRTKTVNPGDDVYAKYFDTTETLIVEMSANNIDLESGMRYTVSCSADMSTGLSVNNSYDFTVSWVDVEYTINADIDIDEVAYTASITPYCQDADGNSVENVTISVYRREYDGSLTEISTGIPNTRTTITDPHPSLDYARYRLIAKDTRTGAISFYDMPGKLVGCSSVIIQWDEAWSRFDMADEYSVEGPAWSGSLLVLPYNISVSDSRKRDVSFITYAGRERPVGYYGTPISESSQWSTTIPKDDVETIYALRRLSLWAGNVYIREPSGMGFWANVIPTFNVKYDSVTIPVSLDITRVEGGV